MAVLYALLYEKPITESIEYLYTTRNIDEAEKYSNDVYPGSTVVELTITEFQGV